MLLCPFQRSQLANGVGDSNRSLLTRVQAIGSQDSASCDAAQLALQDASAAPLAMPKRIETVRALAGLPRSCGWHHQDISRISGLRAQRKLSILQVHGQYLLSRTMSEYGARLSASPCYLVIRGLVIKLCDLIELGDCSRCYAQPVSGLSLAVYSRCWVSLVSEIAHADTRQRHSSPPNPCRHIRIAVICAVPIALFLCAVVRSTAEGSELYASISAAKSVS